MQVNNINPYNYNTEFKGKVVTKQNMTRAIVTSGITGTAGNFSALMLDSLPMLAVGACATAIFFLLNCLKPFIKEKPLELNPKIEFKKAESIEEAEEYAKQNFKIETFKVNDLDVANWINEGLTVLNNKLDGKVYMPKKIIYGDAKGKADAFYHRFTDTLFIKTFDDKKLSLLNDLSEVDLTTVPLGNRFKKFCEDYQNMNNLSKIEKRNLLYSVSNSIDVLLKLSKKPEAADNLSELTANNAFGHVYTGKFSILFHEMGHVFENKSRTFNPLREVQFVKGRKNIIMPDYALSKNKEFVAEIFAGMLEGDKYPKNITDLFKKLCNIRIPD